MCWSKVAKPYCQVCTSQGVLCVLRTLANGEVKSINARGATLLQDELPEQILGTARFAPLIGISAGHEGV